MPEPTAAIRAARTQAARLTTERTRLVADMQRTGVLDRARIDALDARLAGILDRLHDRVDPCDAPADSPLVLLPVRLETRFGRVGRRTVLRVRIYPDDVHVDGLQRGLSDEETAAGRSWWTAAWQDPVPETAWQHLVDAVGAGRAEWVAEACTPRNLAQRGTAQPDFGPVPPAGARRIVARALPDRFVVFADQGGKVSRAVGRPVPPDLQVSPVPLDDQPVSAGSGLTVPQGSEWLVDYQQAEQVGMAVTVTLAQSVTRVDRVVVVGARGSRTPAAGADELEQLLAAHRFGAGGLSLLAQGTPTNNDDSARSPYQRRPAPVPPSLDASAGTARADSDTTALATTLGVDATVATHLLGQGTGEQQVAQWTNTALWQPGWGDYLNRLDAHGVPGLTDAQEESARQLFRDHVRGRGPSPAVRVGAQPYGILPVSDLAAWVPRAGETTAGVLAVVRPLLRRWLYAAQHNVPLVRPGAADVDGTLLEVLGTSPVMQGLRVRPNIDESMAEPLQAALGLGSGWFEQERIITTAVLAQVLGVDASKGVLGSLHDQTRPLPLPLVSDRDPEFVTALLGTPSRVLAVDSVLQALLVLAWQSAELDVAKAAPAEVLPTLVDFVDLTPELRSRAAAMVSRADGATSSELTGLAVEVAGGGVVGGTSLLREYQPLEVVPASLAEVALASPVTAESRRLGASALSGWMLAMGTRAEVREAMTRLAGTGLEARRLAVAEALDCSSHRLDAWATAVVADRRARQAAGRAGARGLTVGAYGVVESLSAQAGTVPDGWLHAPTTRHAIAAGMLRSAHLSHLPDSGTDGGPFAVDLSGTRVRDARQVLDGVRQGQQLAALVGYRIERGLAEAGLARLQLSLRAIAPLVARRLSDRDGSDDQLVQESVAAANVVDGLLLLRLHPPGDETLRHLLDIPPVNEYVAPGTWKPLTGSEWGSVVAVLAAAADTVDAVADVMLSESVVQYAGGNAARAAAAMDAMSSGAAPADTLDVLQVPDSGERITHRVVAVVGGGVPPSPWSTTRPRAAAEPALEAWAAAHLGDPADVVVGEVDGQRVTLDGAGLCALDLVFAPSPDSFDLGVRALLPGLRQAVLAQVRDNGWPARFRAVGEVLAVATSLKPLVSSARALLPDSLVGSGAQPERDLAAALPELRSRVEALAGSLATAVAGLQPTVDAVPPDGIVADQATADAVSAAVVTALDAYGIPMLPNRARPLDLSWARQAWEAAEAMSANAQASVARLAAKVTDGSPAVQVLEAAQDVATGVLGSGFLVVPSLSAPGGADSFVQAVVQPAFPQPPSTAVRRFVRDHATVRPQVRRLSEALLFESALGRPRALTVAQVTEVTDSGPAAGTTTWLAGPLPESGPWPDRGVTHLVLDTVGDVVAGAPLAGIVLDTWVEDLPEQPGTRARPEDPRPGRARTGLAVRANGASSRPPQAVLSLVSPDGARWTADSVRAVVEQTLDLARARMVTLERLAGDARVLPALYTRHSALQGSKFLLWQELAAVRSGFVAMPFVKESAR
ncbi:hypothetical protein GCM10027517_19960 [Phycicoccus ginsengisoli]